MQVVGRRAKGRREPWWPVTDLDLPIEALRLYEARMKIEESFRDEKGLLGPDRLRSRSRERMEKATALVLPSRAMGLRLGEALRDRLYGPPDEAKQEAEKRKWRRYSGLFVWLWQGRGSGPSRRGRACEPASGASAASCSPMPRLMPRRETSVLTRCAGSGIVKICAALRLVRMGNA